MLTLKQNTDICVFSFSYLTSYVYYYIFLDLSCQVKIYKGYYMLNFKFKNDYLFRSEAALTHIILKCADLGYEINLTKGQKLLFCCYGSVLAIFDKRLCDEAPKAWHYGPAFPRAYKHHRDNVLDLNKDELVAYVDKNKTDENQKILKLIDECIEFFGKYNASTLVNWTHKENSPWYVASQGGKALFGPIADTLISNYFKKIIKEE